MNPGRPARWRQLALLTVAVLAAHWALLRPGVSRLAPPRQAALRFDTRSIAPQPVAASVAAPPEPVAAPVPPPAPAAAPPVPPPRPVVPRPRPAAAPAAVPPPAHTPWPDSLTAWPSAVLHYEVAVQARGIALAGTARLDWQQDGQHYDARLELSGPGMHPRVQQSTGAISAAGLVPERFSDRSRSEQATHFDRAGGRIVFSNNRPQADWVAGMQDRLSVVLQVAMLAAAQPARFAPGNEVAIPTATTREAGEWLFRVRGEEELELPGGNVRALKLERLPRGEYDQRFELWLAPGQAYAPVRLRLTNSDGGWVDQRWSSTDRR
jgi:hypothetical protein